MSALANADAPDFEALRTLHREQWATAVPALFVEYLDRLRADGEVEDYRKALAIAVDVLGYREPPPKDPRANLPRAIINIHLDDDAKSVSVELDFDATPTPQMLDAIDVNADVIAYDD